MLRYALTLALCSCAVTASADLSADKIFSERNVDFGAVPRGAKV
jgi:hypothetical protein